MDALENAWTYKPKLTQTMHLLPSNGNEVFSGTAEIWTFQLMLQYFD
jgi:hypothetical protein